MGFLSNISINKKLIVIQMTTFSLVITICALLYLYIDYKNTKDNKTKSLLVVAQVVGSNAKAPLMFNDNDAANDILSDLHVETDITHAAILDTNLNTLGSYTKKGELSYNFKKTPKQLIKTEITSNDIFLFYRVYSDKEWLGTVCLKLELTAMKQQFYDKIKLVGFVVFIGFLMALFVSSFLQKYISKPIIKLAELMNQTQQQRNYKIRAPYNGKDEIGNLSMAFNNMLQKIDEHEKILSEANSQLEQKVKQRTLELEQKNEKLFAANALAEQSKIAKEQFLATMSHEIRTPLNAIIGFQQLLQDTSLTTEQKEYLESIDFASQNLLVIINDILDLSKIEAGKLEINKEILNIKNAIQSVADLVEFNAKEKGLQISFDHDVKIPENVIGDKARFNQILLNLIGNAIKFTERGSVTITSKLISYKEEIVLCQFTVSDTGIGIPPEKQDLIFERFTQASSDTTRKYGGTGLGLAIVQQLLKLQGGNITLESEEGKGSRFTFYIPFGNTDNQTAHASPTTKDDLREYKMPQQLHVLLAEDTPLNQTLVKKIFQKWNYKLDVANNGKEAILLLEKNGYDLILMDIQMPEMDGYTAAKNIRKMNDERKKNIPIIALTAHATNDEAEKCLSQGMNAYMVKPFDPNELLNTMIKLTSGTTGIHRPAISEGIKQTNNLFDLTYLKEHAAGDNLFLIEMISIFLEDTPNFLLQLKKDILNQDYNKIKVTSHSMKGLFLTLGMNEAAILLKEIETNSAEQHFLEKIKSNFEKIEQIFFQSKEPLSLELKKLKANS